MIFDPTSAPHLKPWLVRTLEPICDAEPGALADYILALLKHNVPEPEMRKELTSQLEEFLEKECSSFIDTLFTVLRTKSYLPYNPPSPAPPTADEGIPIPLDSLMPGVSGPSSERTRKRSPSSEERDGRPKKGPRFGQDGDFAGYANGGQQGPWVGPQQPFGGMEGFPMQMNPMAMGMAMNGMGSMGGRRPQGYQPPGQRRGVCRDYHNNGYCARGEMCKYSHGEGAVVPSQLYPMNMPLNFLYNMFNQNAPYDPNDPQLTRQNQRAPLLPRIPQEAGGMVPPTNTGGELPVIQDLTPTVPSEAGKSNQPHPLNGQAPSQSDPSGLPMAGNGFNPAMFTGTPNFNGMQMQQMPMMGEPGARPQGGFRGRGGKRGGRGGTTAGADSSQHRPPRRGDKTLVVEKIPEEKLSQEQILAWFKKFGEVTNVAVDFSGAKALVSFETHDEAHAAWKSEDAVFGNRFVKVFWHRPMEGHGQLGQRVLAASATLVANMKSENSTPAGSSSSITARPLSASTSSANLKKSGTALALAAKQELLGKQIAEQKSLMASLSTATPEQKKTIMARLRKLGEEMEAASSSTTTPAPPSTQASPAADAEEGERQRLDKELGGNGAGEGEESTEQLKAKLEKLKAEAASLGIADGGHEYPQGGYRGGYRGRARGRGFYRGGPPLRGLPRGSLKLDNRPKKLLVKNVPGADGLQAVKEFYESGGQVESVESVDGCDVVVSFKSRASAEQAFAKGSVLPTMGKVPISWYTPQQGHSSVKTSSTPATETSSPAQKMKDLEESHPPEDSSSSHIDYPQEEEMAPSGWGDDDGMGML